MNPGRKRFARPRKGHWPAMTELTAAEAEAIVRAVLMELRELSDDGFAAMEAALKRPRQQIGHRTGDQVRGAYIALDAYVDHILGTMARREAALSELGLVALDIEKMQAKTIGRRLMREYLAAPRRAQAVFDNLYAETWEAVIKDGVS